MAGEGDSEVLTDRVGLVGVLALLVGNAISIPIFVLPGPLAGDAGPAVILAALLAAVPATLTVLFNAQFGSAMPVAGGLYVYITRLTAPFWGFCVPFTLPIVTWAGLLFAAIGFAEYARFFVDVPTAPLIYVFLLFVLFVNLLGIKTVVKAQVILVIGLVASLALFIIPGAVHVDPNHYTPMFPEGGVPVAVAVVALVFPFLGFGLLTELGEEIENPGKTIPLALFSGIAIVTAVYLALIAVLVGVMPWYDLGGTEAAVAEAGTIFLPGPLAGVVAFGAFFAVLTSVNMTLLVGSRTVMRAGRDGILPPVLSRIHPRFNTPYVSILVLGAPPLLFAAFIQEEVVELSVFIGLTVFTAIFFSAIALWNLPVEYPEHYQNATLQFRRRRGLLLAVVSAMSISAILWIVTLIELPVAGLLLLSWFLLGYLVYRYMIWRRGDRRRELFVEMVTLDDHEQAFAERQTYDDLEED